MRCQTVTDIFASARFILLHCHTESFSLPLSLSLSPFHLAYMRYLSIRPTSHPSQSLGLNKACDVLPRRRRLFLDASTSGEGERICFKVFSILEMVCLYSKYTTLLPHRGTLRAQHTCTFLKKKEEKNNDNSI